jgi:dihydroorotate dehydrogenase
MANLKTEFCGLEFKNPIVVASAETGNSLDNIKKCIDYGAGGVIIKTVGDIPEMQTLTNNSKYAILNDQGELIRGKVNRSFFFYSRSGYAKEHYEEWIPILREAQIYAQKHSSHIIGNIASNTIEGWIKLAKAMKECGIQLVELNYQWNHPTDYKGPTEGNWIAQDPNVTANPTKRLFTATESAPASCAAFAIEVRLCTSGVSFTIILMSTVSRIRRVTSAVTFGSCAIQFPSVGPL